LLAFSFVYSPTRGPAQLLQLLQAASVGFSFEGAGNEKNRVEGRLERKKEERRERERGKREGAC
jgi:hypothetical protein